MDTNFDTSSAIESANLIANFQQSAGPGHEHLLNLGGFLEARRLMDVSTKIRGIKLKADVPKIAAIPSSLRSDLIWLFIMHSHSNLELLTGLRVARLSDFHSQNASVIRQTYRRYQVELERSK